MVAIATNKLYYFIIFILLRIFFLPAHRFVNRHSKHALSSCKKRREARIYKTCLLFPSIGQTRLLDIDLRTWIYFTLKGIQVKAVTFMATLCGARYFIRHFSGRTSMTRIYLLPRIFNEAVLPDRQYFPQGFPIYR